MSKKYIVAIIFKNGMKLCSKPLSKKKAKEYFISERSDFYSSIKYSEKIYTFEDSVFKTGDIFMVTMVEEQKND